MQPLRSHLKRTLTKSRRASTDGIFPAVVSDSRLAAQTSPKAKKRRYLASTESSKFNVTQNKEEEEEGAGRGKGPSVKLPPRQSLDHRPGEDDAGGNSSNITALLLLDKTTHSINSPHKPLRKPGALPSSSSLFRRSLSLPRSSSSVVIPPTYCKDCIDKTAQDEAKLNLLLNQASRISFPTYQHQLQYLRSLIGTPMTSLRTVHSLKRCRLINFMVYCQCRLPHPPSPYTLHVGIACLDRFCAIALRRGDKDAKLKLINQLPAVGAACLHLASKLEDVWPIDSTDLAIAASGTFAAKDILVWEKRICQVLDFKISSPTALDFLVMSLSDLRLNPPQAICGSCGEDMGGNASLLPYYERLFHPEGWNPQHKEAKGRTALDACATFLIELVLVHPAGISSTYDSLAAAALAVVVAVLLQDKFDLHGVITHMPPKTRAILLQTTSAIPTVSAAYSEFLAAADQKNTSADHQAKVVTSILPPAEMQVDPSDANYKLFAEAVELYSQSQTSSAIAKMAAFIIARFHSSGRSIGAAAARSVASQVLDGTIQRPKTHPLPVEPLETSNTHPLGLFAADVASKHADASAFLGQRFRMWVEKTEGKVGKPRARMAAVAAAADPPVSSPCVTCDSPTPPPAASSFRKKGQRRRAASAAFPRSPVAVCCSSAVSSSSCSGDASKRCMGGVSVRGRLESRSVASSRSLLSTVASPSERSTLLVEKATPHWDEIPHPIIS